MNTVIYTHIVVLIYKRTQIFYTRRRHVKNIKHEINEILPEDKNMQLVYTGTRLATKFNATVKAKRSIISI